MFETTNYEVSGDFFPMGKIGTGTRLLLGELHSEQESLSCFGLKRLFVDATRTYQVHP